MRGHSSLSAFALFCMMALAGAFLFGLAIGYQANPTAPKFKAEKIMGKIYYCADPNEEEP